MSVINVKALIKEIKKSASKDRLYWQQLADAHYITNSHWLVKLQGNDFTAVRPALLEMFQQEPTVGQTLEIMFKKFGISKAQPNFVHRPTQAYSGKLTPLLVQLKSAKGKAVTRQFATFGGDIVALDGDLAALIQDETCPLYRADANGAIYVGETGDLLLLPVRPPKVNEVETPWKQVIENYLSGVTV